MMPATVVTPNYPEEVKRHRTMGVASFEKLAAEYGEFLSLF